MTITVVPSPLPAPDADAVRALAAAATAHDGVAPLNEHTLLHLRRPVDGDRHVLARDDAGTLAGYAFLDGAETSAELVVAPVARRRGVGTAVAGALRSIPDAGGLKVWAHGGHPGAAPLAARVGLSPVRELFRMSRDETTAAALPEPRIPDGITVRTFVPGADDAGWLAVNARAFADHPEQGSWGPAELADRQGEAWFDPAGFFLAEDPGAGRLAGFHWTKVHDAPPHGEVYVVGVDPAYQGTGLGKALTVVGVRHLHTGGLRTVELYVDGANTAARQLYGKLGFEVAAVDVQYGVGPGL